MQTITRTNVDPVHRRLYAATGGDEFNNLRLKHNGTHRPPEGTTMVADGLVPIRRQATNRDHADSILTLSYKSCYGIHVALTPLNIFFLERGRQPVSIFVVGGSRSLDNYSDVIMSPMSSQITSLTIVFSTVYSDADQRKYQSSASLAFVRGIHRGPANSPHNWPVTWKMFPFDDVIMDKDIVKAPNEH